MSFDCADHGIKKGAQKDALRFGMAKMLFFIDLHSLGNSMH